MEIKITRPQGTEDVTPKQIYKWHTVERIARETAESFGFHETRIPTFENTNLFLRSVGETTEPSLPCVRRAQPAPFVPCCKTAC